MEASLAVWNLTTQYIQSGNRICERDIFEFNGSTSAWRSWAVIDVFSILTSPWTIIYYLFSIDINGSFNPAHIVNKNFVAVLELEVRINLKADGLCTPAKTEAYLTCVLEKDGVLNEGLELADGKIQVVRKESLYNEIWCQGELRFYKRS